MPQFNISVNFLVLYLTLLVLTGNFHPQVDCSLDFFNPYLLRFPGIWAVNAASIKRIWALLVPIVSVLLACLSAHCQRLQKPYDIISIEYMESE